MLGKQFAIYGDYDNPLFLAKDVAQWIEHSDVSTMLRKIDEDEKETNIVCTLGGKQEAWFLTEDGLLEVLMQSRKPIAKEFKKQVKAILKAIRKTGHYETPEYKLALETKEKLDNLEQIMINSGLLRIYVNPRHAFDRLAVRYKIATNDDKIRGFYDAIGNYFGIRVPYSNDINVTVKDWILSKLNIEEIQDFILGIETDTIVKSYRGNYVNLNGFGSNSVEWNKVLNEFNHCCAYCGKETALIPEHVIPQSVLSQEHPEKVDLIGNIVCACGNCNGSKNKSEMESWFREQTQFTESKLRKIQSHINKYEL